MLSYFAGYNDTEVANMLGVSPTSIVRTVNQPDGSKQRIVDQEIKAYILSERAMKIMVKYDLNKKPSKRRPPQSGSSSDFDLTG